MIDERYFRVSLPGFDTYFIDGSADNGGQNEKSSCAENHII